MSEYIENSIHYTVKEISVIINESYGVTIRRIRRGDMKSKKVAGSYFVSHHEVVRYLDEHEALPESMIDYRLHNKPVKKVSNLG